MPIFLNVPYAEKDEAKALGARWNGQKRRWYVPEGVTLLSFERWLPQFSESHVAQPAQSVTEPTRKRTQGKSGDLFERVDEIGGKTTIGDRYFDTQHNCIPWEHCDQCQAAISRRLKANAC